MKSLVYNRPGKRSWDNKPKPETRGADYRHRPHHQSPRSAGPISTTFGNAAREKALKVLLTAG